jgi:hypothetical protein
MPLRSQALLGRVRMGIPPSPGLRLILRSPATAGSDSAALCYDLYERAAHAVGIDAHLSELRASGNRSDAYDACQFFCDCKNCGATSPLSSGSSAMMCSRLVNTTLSINHPPDEVPDRDNE